MILSSVLLMPMTSNFVEDTSRERCPGLHEAILTFHFFAHIAEVENETGGIQSHHVTTEYRTMASAIELGISTEGEFSTLEPDLAK